MTTLQADRVDYSSTPAMLEEHVLERKGCPVHYWLGGPEDRPLVVMMHGATMDHRMFNPQVMALIDDYWVLEWDARGHGKSRPMGEGFSIELCVEDMLALLDWHGAGRVVLVGQSLGGYIAQRLYFHAPGRVQAIVIIGSTPVAKPYSRLEIGALKASLPVFDLWPYESFTRTVAHSTAKTPDARRYALEAIRQIPRQDFLRIWKAVTLAVDRKGLPGHTIDVPLLLTHGDMDRTGTIRRDMPGWLESEPDAKHIIIPDASHNANQDNPHYFNQVLLNFLSERVG